MIMLKLLRALIYSFIIACTFLVMSSCINQTIKFNSPDSIQKLEVQSYVIISDDFSVEQRTNIIKGLKFWMIASNGLVKIEIVPTTWKSISENIGISQNLSTCNLVVVVNLGLPFDQIAIDADVGDPILGLTHRRPCSYTTIWLYEPELTSTRSWEIVSAHEFGHALGLSHINDSHSVMNEFYSDHKVLGCLTKNDMKEFCREYDCKVENMIFCSSSLTCM